MFLNSGRTNTFSIETPVLFPPSPSDDMGRVRVRSEMEAQSALTSGVTPQGSQGEPLGNPPVVVFILGRGGVLRGHPVAGQLSE
jgi:hypothetical protein